MTIASAALIALPFAGSALADGARPHPTATAKAPQPAHSAPAKQDRHGKEDTYKHAKHKTTSLKVAVSSSRVRAGSSYAVTITTKGLSSGTATLTTPEGRTYRVPLSSGRARKNLTVPSRTRAGTKTVTVKVAGKTATASFTVTAASKRHHGR
ncbi:hypothetical protein AB0I81_44765 [Nonomuraea sp. NPDC050404]|uniref:hypothetical protein n=1 Tax=Nonomuraea sp. NPDC050404 TaxID=3155783 RepID=UPI0033E1EA27